MADGRGHTPGSSAFCSAIAAQRLGLQAAVVTSCSPRDPALTRLASDAGVWVKPVTSRHTTTFLNVYDPAGRRTQVLEARANDIGAGDVPDAWRGGPIVHLGPVAQELPPELIAAFPRCLLGITPQGWMRSWDDQGRVAQEAWP